MAYTVAPFPYHQFFDDDGAIAAGHKLYTYESGTTTALATYSDSAGTANANPIVLDSAGRAKIFLSGNTYKFVLKTAADVTVWTIDNVAATPAFDVDLTIPGTAGEALSAGDVVYLSDGSGSKTAGRWYQADADETYSSTIGTIGMVIDAIASGASGTVTLAGRITGLSGLTAGTTYYVSATAGALTSTAPTNTRIVGVAESTTALILSNWAGTRPASATEPGVVDCTTQTIAGAKTFSGAMTLSSTLDVGGQATLDLVPTFKAGSSEPTGATVRPVGIIQESLDFTSYANTGTGEETARTFSLPANVMDANNHGIIIHAWFQMAANANNKRLYIKMDSGGGGGSIGLLGAAAHNAMFAHMRSTVIRTGVGTQIGFNEVITMADSGAAPGSDGDIVSGLTMDETTALTINIIVDALVASAGDITYYGSYIEVF